MKNKPLAFLTFSLFLPTSVVYLGIILCMMGQRLSALRFSRYVTLLFISAVALYFYGLIISNGPEIGTTFHVLVFLLTYLLLDCLIARGEEFSNSGYLSGYYRLYLAFYSINILYIAFEDAYLAGFLKWGGALISDRTLADGIPQSLLFSSQAAATYCGLAVIHGFIWLAGDILKAKSWERGLITLLAIYGVIFLARFPNHTVLLAIFCITILNLMPYLAGRINVRVILGGVRIIFFLVFIYFYFDFSAAIELFFKKTLAEMGGARATYYWEAFLNPVEIWIYELSIIEKLLGVGTTKSLATLEHADFGLFVMFIESGVIIFVLLFAALFRVLAKAYLILCLNVSRGISDKSLQLYFSTVLFIVLGSFHYTPFFTAPGILLLVVNYVLLSRFLHHYSANTVRLLRPIRHGQRKSLFESP